MYRLERRADVVDLDVRRLATNHVQLTAEYCQTGHALVAGDSAHEYRLLEVRIRRIYIQQNQNTFTKSA